ncbi:1-phosphatidylinositol-3-phosphate 5-kinase FAB1B-like isoform X1 [Cucurbita pepo subsp. pepo]|uniref:1-phosphatidylinositol-3-phosphate 5-kinase FAB1B-like isoform X1 n=1 Tax=Cucurbita pepo subsp. pepo TaxID=3664 RepID=UPI000C9D4C50|nr:1-phosphatidylinositol-3-phosphate 5-kinase FAB1B-like isoform X1 [Cucurbita pepo subsp. pepo]
MGHPENKLSDLVGLVKSWMPWRSDPENVSRDFWMPDKSCRVCYDCDSQFTFINRRHHCRRCGRVFCSKCTANFIPSPSTDPSNAREDSETIRVCNYCFKQWGKEPSALLDGDKATCSAISLSSSSTSIGSTKSGYTCQSAISNIPSTPCSNDRQYYDPFCSGSIADEQDSLRNGKTIKRSTSLMTSSSSYYGYCRSDDEDGDYYYGMCRSDSESRHIPQSDHYYCSANTEEGLNLERENMSTKGSPVNFDTQSPRGDEESGEDSDENDKGSECDFPTYGMQNKDNEAMDFQNNGILWLPPEPEDEEDEKALLFNGDDDACAPGEWGHLPSSQGSGECPMKRKSSGDYRRTAKNVVEGHFRALVSQLLEAENLPVGDEPNEDGWLDILTYLSWEAAAVLKPDTSKSGCMDPGGYVKVKCVAGGKRTESIIVKGIICKKNVAHRRMRKEISKPRFFVLGGALEYQRVTNHLSSFDTLLQQELDHLKMAVAKIDAHHPNVLLVEKSVSRHAQEYLLSKKITLVLNVKRSLLERIACCTGANIVPTVDHVACLKLGYCDEFRVKTFVEEHGSGDGQAGKKSTKTLMFFEGCPKPLCCTILLRGASGDELKKVKHVVQYATFAAYHLALETCFLADEGASVPELPLKSPIIVGLPHTPSNIDRSISAIPGFTCPSPVKSPEPEPSMETGQSGNDAVPTRDSSMISHNVDNLNSLEPSLRLVKSNATSTSLSFLKQNVSTADRNYILSSKLASEANRNPDSEEYSMGIMTIKEEAKEDDDTVSSSGKGVPLSHGNSIHIRSSSLDANTQSSNDSTCQRTESLVANLVTTKSSREDFPLSPSDQQNILVSLSTRCVWKGTICDRAHLLRIKYYGSFDKPLGRFLRDNLFDQNYRCHSCGMPSEAHVHCYTHPQGSLTISAKKLPDFFLPGEPEGKIWMWHRCLKCPRTNGFPPATRRVIMSDAAWGLSFGKFLELSFSNNAAASRVAGCGHFLHRDCLRFYGFGRTVACFHYAAINVKSVHIPPSIIDFHHNNLEWINKEANEVHNRAEVLFAVVCKTLPLILKHESGTEQEDFGVNELNNYIQELEQIINVEKEDFEVHFNKASGETTVGQPTVDIFEINKLHMHVLFLSYIWVQRLSYAVTLGKKHSPDSSSNDIPTLEEKELDSMEELVELTLAFGQDDLFGGFDNDSLPSESKHDVDLDRGGNSGQMNRFNETEREKNIDLGGQEDDLCLYQVNSEPLDVGTALRRTNSEGEYPSMTDLSGTLDAVWKGALHPNSIQFDDRYPQTNSSILEPLAGPDMEKCTANGVETARLLYSALVLTRVDSVETCTSLMSMPSSAYSSKISLLNIPKPDISDYDPALITSFRELEKQGHLRFFMHVDSSDTVVPVYDEEPTSIIAYSLLMPEYHAQMSEPERVMEALDTARSLPTIGSVKMSSIKTCDEEGSDVYRTLRSNEETILSMARTESLQFEDLLLFTKDLHTRVCFINETPLGPVKYTITCYFAKRFEALRKKCCPSELDYVRSLSRCKRWGAQGGKSNVFFAKTLDERFIIKQVTKIELESFIQFAPAYFLYLSESIRTGCPTCLAKVVGMYQVSTKHLKGGKEFKIDVLVMENLLFGHNVTRLYDLKGSSRSRYNSDTSGKNKVLLDQNLIESMPTSPIFLGGKAKRLLERAVWNDTSFLASIDVMDYSLLVGLDEEKQELVVGIIDFMRQYTWDKHLETWVKNSGILGGPKNAAPTVISPHQYKKRFRKAMTTYFLMVPDQWPSSTISPSESHPDLCDENSEPENSWDCKHCSEHSD